MDDDRRQVRAALEVLGIQRLVLVVHDASFPAGPDEDVGRGSPYSRAAGELFAFASALGFDGVQLGPQGKTSLGNPSPYDGSLMAKSPLSVALAALVDGPGTAGLLPTAALARAVARRPPAAAQRADHRYAWGTALGALRTAYRRFARAPEKFPQLSEPWRAFQRRNADWLEADGLFEALTALHGTDDPTRWRRGRQAAQPAQAEIDRRLYSPAPGERARAEARRRSLRASNAELIAFHGFCQLLIDQQHRQLRERLVPLGLRLYADLQVGYAARDVWRYRRLFLDNYLMGAPPSRTNPAGQAWGFPLLDPDLYFAGGQGGGARGRRPGPALRFFGQRIERLLSEFDGLRIDHPHGLVCPWVYRPEGPDQLAAVRDGARLFSSPHLPEHPALAHLAIARRRDLAPAAAHRPRYADDWVRALSSAQVARYAVLLDQVMALARAHGRSSADICPEVLSTCPYPLARVLARHGLGRVRVVQKADPTDPRDAYRSETSAPADWITLGTHDTAPIWQVARGWRASGRQQAWAAYLAQRLESSPAARASMAARLASDEQALVQALFADLFVGPAGHVSLFFADLFGQRETYNVPGTIDDRNWTLRVPPDFASLYRRRRASGQALDIRAALALALRARTRGARGEASVLAEALASPRAPGWS